MNFERFFEFMGNHPFLFGIMAVLIVMFFMVETKRSGKKVSPSGLGLLVNNDNAQIIDIRAKKKFDTGHIQGSRNIPLADLKDRLDEIRAIEAPIVVVCDLGMQAGTAVQLIGKPNAMRLEGGIGGWQSAGMPLVGDKYADGKSHSKSTKTVKPVKAK